MENQQLVSFHNAPAHRSVLVTDFLAKNNVTTLECPPNSPDLAPADRYLHPRLKSALMGRRFCDASETMKKGFHKMASRNVSNTFAVDGRSL
jgi:hypothetical protein